MCALFFRNTSVPSIKRAWRSCVCMMVICLAVLFFTFQTGQLVILTGAQETVISIAQTASAEHVPRSTETGQYSANLTQAAAAKFFSEMSTALHSDVWLSQARIVYHTLSPFGPTAPVQCSFTHVFVDMSRVFFVARKGREAEAAADLFDCCINFQYGNYIDATRCQRSVTVDFCRCFHQGKVAPGVAASWHLLELPPPLPATAAATTATTATATTATSTTSTTTITSLSHSQIPDVKLDAKAEESVMPRLTGVTWLMHHWATQHHPDHFGMKILELHGLVYNSRQEVSAANAWLSQMPPPNDIAQLLSFDYPLDNFTAYESFLLEMLFRELGELKPYMSAFTPDWRSYFFNKQFHLSTARRLDSLCMACCQPSSLSTSSHFPPLTRRQRPRVASENNLVKWIKDISHLQHKPREFADLYKLPIALSLPQICRKVFHLNDNSTRRVSFPKTFYVEHAYLSPQYVNNVPFPYTSSTTGLHTSLSKYKERHAMENQHLGLSPCVSPLLPSAHLRIALLQRSEGVGRRQFVNLNAVLASLQSVAHEDFIDIVYLNSQTSPIVQATKFCNYHIIVTPHSSQLANLVFAPSNISIIEVQNENYQADPFFKLGKKMNLHYQIIKKGNIAHSGGQGSTNSGPVAAAGKKAILTDVLVHIPNFDIAVKKAVSHVKASGYIIT